MHLIKCIGCGCEDGCGGKGGSGSGEDLPAGATCGAAATATSAAAARLARLPAFRRAARCSTGSELIEAPMSGRITETTEPWLALAADASPPGRGLPGLPSSRPAAAAAAAAAAARFSRLRAAESGMPKKGPGLVVPSVTFPEQNAGKNLMGLRVAETVPLFIKHRSELRKMRGDQTP